ncbi:MAG: hypothetical protein VX983_03410 [Actinomycetota bacterium]|nr:hypothetical protein [Acidimicrobiales bacterium]MED5541113.1 hypothetical protein [Actinomycetota bacterium]MEE2805528.1 hypothetical protein [Actinomycetota bacterium]
MANPLEPLSKSSSVHDNAQLPTALPSVLARVLAFSAVILASLCGGLMGFALGRLQWGESRTAWVFIAGAAGSALAAMGVAVVGVLVLRAMSEWADVASVKARRP